MKLYVDPITVTCRKVLAGFELLDVDYERVIVDSLHAVLPVLADGDLVLFESNAILQYAAEKAPRSTYYPPDRTTRAEIRRWMLWESSSWYPSCYVLMVEGSVKPRLGQKADQRILEEQEKNFHRLAHTLDACLSLHPWLCGDHMTLADLVVAAPLYLQPYQKLPIEHHVHLQRWLSERMSCLPCWNPMPERASPPNAMDHEDLTLVLFDN
jgi:glutathione S-transferase